MPLMPGVWEPGAQSLTTVVTVDANAWLAAASGRRVTSVAATVITGTPKIELYRMTTVNTDNLTTGRFCSFQFGTTGPGTYFNNWGPAGVDCSNGVSINWTTPGTADLTITYIDVT